jgi:predicted GH43/DUF377 family glycosyl hydrolase
MKLKRFEGNPILSAHPAHPWEDLAVFNPAAWYDEEKHEVLLLYRTAESHPDYKCWFGLARSRDGLHFERVSSEPVLGPSVEGFDGATIQDPRIIKMGQWFYVTYACRHYPFGQFWVPGVRQKYIKPDCPPEFPRYLRVNATLTGLAMTKDFKTWIRAGWLTDPLLDDRDVILFPGFPAAPSKQLIKNKYPWEAAKLGINTPPIKTPHGWFTIYHAVGPDKFYRLGALLLSLTDPSQVLHRTPDWLMQPETDYEINGFYRGVCFPCGAVVLDGTLFVYYGAGDKYCAVATCDFDELLNHLLSCPA